MMVMEVFMRVLMLDGYNLIHRARSGFTKGEHYITFNFFRGIRPIIEKFKPDVVYFVLEGTPVANIQALPEYKGNRPVAPDSFRAQRDEIISIVKECFPFRVVWHPNYECDDVLHSVVKNWHADDDVTVISTDSDFIQLYQTHPHVNVWHPINKEFVRPPAEGMDYVIWKALRGDKTDNVPGVAGVSDKRATELASDPEVLQQFLTENPDAAQVYNRNLGIIKLDDLGPDMSGLDVHVGKSDWEKLKDHFASFQFQSMIKSGTWEKYVRTFDGDSSR
jgi:DNA polymerase I